MKKLRTVLEHVEVTLTLGHDVPVPGATSDRMKRLLGSLNFQLALLINRLYQVTDALPLVGDVLALEPDKLGGWRELLDGHVPSRWVIEKRCFLNPGGKLTVVYKLHWVVSAGVAEVLDGEALDKSELLDLMPTTLSKRSLTQWLNRPERPILTWEQLARHADELPDQRGFNAKYLRLIEPLLRQRGLTV